MKRVFRTLCLVAMVALVATSCKKNETNTSITVSVEEVQGLQANPSFDGSKAYFDPNDNFNFKWEVGDEIMVYNLASDYTKSLCARYVAKNGGSGTAQFNIKPGENIGSVKNDLGYRVFFNADLAEGNLQADNRETFTVEAEQNYDKNYRMDPSAIAMASTLDAAGADLGNFHLQHIFGYLNVGVGHNMYAAKTVSTIVVEDDKTNLSGQLTLKLHLVDPAMFTTLMNECETSAAGYEEHLSTYLQQLGYQHGDNSTKTITMNCNQELTPAQWSNFYIALRPGALYKGFTITVNFTDGTSWAKTFTETEAMGYLIKPGTFKNIWFLSGSGFYM